MTGQMELTRESAWGRVIILYQLKKEYICNLYPDVMNNIYIEKWKWELELEQCSSRAYLHLCVRCVGWNSFAMKKIAEEFDMP